MSKKCKCPEPEGGGDFMTTFADMMTLLLCFFVLLFSMATIEEAKFIVLLKGLEANFGNSTLQEGLLNGGPSIIGANMANGSAIPVPGGSMQLMVSEPSEGGDTASDDVGGTDDQDQESGVADADDKYLTNEDLEQLREQLQAVLDEAGRSDEVNFRFDERGLVISIASDDVLFESGSAELRDLAHGVLELIAPELARFPNAVFVDGHTDDVPFPGTDYTNRELSAERAVVVARELERVYGIAPQRLIPAGYGEWRPIADNSTEEGRVLNRRVELVIAAGSASAPDTGDPVGDEVAGESDVEASTQVGDVPTEAGAGTQPDPGS